MKKAVLLLWAFLMGGHSLYAQEYADNGVNLTSICPSESCSHLYFNSTIYFPYDYDREWEIRNMELAMKNNGNFIATGDLYVYGADTAVILALELEFYSEKDKLLHTHAIPQFEFYNEPETAEPFVTSGKMDKELITMVSYYDVMIKDSKRVPYYEISSDCYHACKEHKLNEAKKAFRKSK